MGKRVPAGLAACLIVAGLATSAHGITDAEVVKAIEKGQQWLMSQQGPNGAWPEARHHAATADYGYTEMAVFTLVYTGIHPNRDVVAKGLDVLLTRQLDYTYAVSMRTMALAHLQSKLTGDKRDTVRKALQLDAMWLVQAQGSHGGWDYKTLAGSDGRYDLSNTQMAILALREAALAGVEIPDIVWKRSQTLYFRLQKPDGAWNYGEHNDHIGKGVPGYGTMTAAGLASIFITTDNLDLASGCPCRGTVSNKVRGDFERRIDSALNWLEKNFLPDGNPKAPDGPGWHKYYWLYSVERVGMAAGYKYFGNHNWFKEGAEHVVKAQGGGGSWGNIPDTCFAILFLYKGRAPILYNKLEFKGEWNNHRRDIANLVGFIEKTKEQPFQWQIVSLKAPVEELHDAPILYITAETEPQFTPEEKKKLREFCDTGGTILFEPSCGNPAVRKYIQALAKELWPEYALKPIGPDHGSFTDPYQMKQRPEVLGLDDGIRTFFFYAMDDISCPWQMKSYTNKDYLFKWGINLYSYATDHSPLRAKLQEREPEKTDRFTTPVKAGDKTTLRLARVKYDGNWIVGRQYKGLERIAKTVAQRASVNLAVEEQGLAPAELGDRNIAYLVGSGEVKFSDADRQALKAYLAGGGFLWAEAANGSTVFDASFRKLAADMGWQLKQLPQTHPMLSGKFPKGVGYSLAADLQFRKALRVSRIGPRSFAELAGIYQDGKLVGVYSPFDVVFCSTGYDAYGCRGYQTPDALAVATNVILYVTDRPADQQ